MTAQVVPLHDSCVSDVFVMCPHLRQPSQYRLEAIHGLHRPELAKLLPIRLSEEP